MSLSRRDFLRNSGALIVSFSATSIAGPFAVAQVPFDTHRSHIDPTKVDSWIAVAADGLVTAYTGKCDFGQGMFTAQTQLVAEELCVPIWRVKLIQCDTSVAPDPGNHFWKSVHADKLQLGQSCAGSGNSARGPDKYGIPAVGRAGRSAQRV